MKKFLKVALFAIAPLACAICLGVLSSPAHPVSAAGAGGYEYGYFVGVPRLAQYNEEMKSWNGSADDKKYLAEHIFAFESGDTPQAGHVNSLRLINDLAAKGWEPVDFARGVMRRAK